MKHNCYGCPYIEDQFNNRMRGYYESVKNGTADKIYGDMTIEDIENDSIDYCWCDKVGYKTWLRRCEENNINTIPHKCKNKKSKSNKRSREEKHLQRLIYLNSIANYPPPVMYIKEKWDKEQRCYIPVEKPYYKRLYRNNHKGGRYRFYKKHANKVVRNYGIGIVDIDEDIDDIFQYHKSDGQLKKGGSYKKVFDYWWTVD